MTIVMWGKKCDRAGCTVVHNNYDVGDIVYCADCGLDLCGACQEATGHRLVRETCCGECPGPELSCEAT